MYEPVIEKLVDAFIIVAVRESTYPEISKQLQQNGLLEFQDYIFYEWIFKKIVLLHGNCHMSVIGSFLRSSALFNETYSIYPNPPICYNVDKKIGRGGVENCDIWIHEDIRPNNIYGYYLCDEYIRGYLRTDAKEIIVPNLFELGKCIFPQSGWNKHNSKIANGRDFNGMFPHSDKVIDKCVEIGMDKKDIIELCMGDKAIDKNEIKENFETYINKIRNREKSWDIKILDYILLNYKKEKLFYNIGHPTNAIMKKISIEILELLDINTSDIYTSECMDDFEEPVYPIVKETLGLEWKDKFIRKRVEARKASNTMDFKEYIEEYLWWCYGM